MQPIFDSLLGYSFLSTYNPKLKAPKIWEDMGGRTERAPWLGASDLNMKKSMVQ